MRTPLSPVCVAALLSLAVSCDQPPPSPPAKPLAAEVVGSVPALQETGVGVTPRVSFANDAEFALYAAKLEPQQFTVASGIRAVQLTPDGRWALGTRFNKANYLFWTVGRTGDDFASFFLDGETGDAPEPHRNFLGRNAFTRLSPDGRWGVFVEVTATDRTKSSIWRLPAQPSEKPEKLHSFSEESNKLILEPSITPDGRRMLCTQEGRWTLVSVDAASGKVETIGAVALPVELTGEQIIRVRLESSAFTGRCLVAVTRTPEAAGGDNRHDLGIGRLNIITDADGKAGVALEMSRWLVQGHPKQTEVLGESSDGRWLILREEPDLEVAPAKIWRLPERVEEPPTITGELAVTTDAYAVKTAWTRDGRRLAVAADGKLQLFDVARLADAAPQPYFTEDVPYDVIDMRFDAQERNLIVLNRFGGTTIVPLDQPREVDAQIGEASIRWSVPGTPPTSEKWPALKASHRIKAGESPVPTTVIIEVRNEGGGAAEQVRCSLSVSPPLMKPHSQKPGESIAVSDVGLVHLGTIGPSLQNMRFLDLPDDPLLLAKARRFSLHTRAAFGFHPAPIHWLHLPDVIRNEADYHATAKLIFDKASQALVQAKGSPFAKPPTLHAMKAGEFGFRVSFGQAVMYQNPFVMNDAALRVNRAVMQVDSQGDLMRHAQMMLYWYLPHELVHCADHRTSWATEYVANTIQPYLTARILESMPDAPYTAQSMAYVYDRYVEKLAPHLSPEEIANVERFIQSDGQGPPPWKMSAPDLFRHNTPAYVYFGARINQHAWSMQSTLEDLCKRYLSP